MKTDHDKRVVDLPFHFALCITFPFVTFVPECKSLVNLESARFIFISMFQKHLFRKVSCFFATSMQHYCLFKTVPFIWPAVQFLDHQRREIKKFHPPRRLNSEHFHVYLIPQKVGHAINFFFLKDHEVTFELSLLTFVKRRICYNRVK